MKRFLFAVAIAAMAFASMSGTALAKNPKASASFLRGDALCGGNNGGAVIGKAKFERLGNTVSIKSFSTKNADPFAEYTIRLWSSSPCAEITDFGSFETNKKGVFKYKNPLSVSVSAEETEFFATIYDELTGYNDTTSVFLP